jgi:hypothetical protein
VIISGKIQLIEKNQIIYEKVCFFEMPGIFGWKIKSGYPL